MRTFVLTASLCLHACSEPRHFEHAPSSAGKSAQGGAVGSVQARTDSAEPSSTQAASASVIAEPADEAARIYDPATVLVFDVEVAPTDLARVDAEPSVEEYVPARLHFEGTTYDIGYRYKGSVGAFRPPCTAAFDGGAKAGKCSVKLSFNWKDPEGRFYGLKKLVFHAMNKDPSQLRERLGYSLFREMGVPAPRASHAVLKVNGKAEMYLSVEEIDGRFTRSRFVEGGEGNLYKEIWPIHDDPNAYLAALETNEDQEPSAARMLGFKEAIARGPDAMASWLDLDVTTSYVAVDRVIMNDDGAFHFYCVEGGKGNNPVLPGNHNYFWYEEHAADRLWIIPWDLDNSMSNSTSPPHLPVDWRSRPEGAACSSCGRGGFGLDGPAPGCDPVIQNFQAWHMRYETKVDAFIAGPFSQAAVDEKLERWKGQIVDAGFAVQDAAVSTLRGILEQARLNRGFKY